MRTDVIEQADLAVGIPERDQVFAKQPHSQRRTVAFRQIAGLQDRNPILPHQFAHGSSRPDAREEQILGFGHGPDIRAMDGKSRVVAQTAGLL